MIKVFATSWHPSATNSIIPVIKELENRGHMVYSLGSQYSSSIFDKNNVSYTLAKDYDIPDFSVNSMEKILRQKSPQVVLAGASFQEPKKSEIYIPDQTVLIAASNLGIPSVRVQDWWSPSTKYDDIVQGVKKAFLPDRIALMDDYVLDKMINDGFPKNRLIVTGYPELDSLSQKKKAFTEEKRREIFEKIKVDSSTPLYFHAASIDWTKNREKLGYWNMDHLEIFTNALRDLNGEDLNVLVGFHPRTPEEDKEILNKFLENKDSRIIPVYGLGSMGLDSDEVSLAADLTTTSFSTVGVKSAYMGKASMSLQPNLVLPSKFEDGEVEFFVKNRDYIPIGLSSPECVEMITHAARDNSYLPGLEASLKNSPFNLGEGKSTKNVADLVESII